MKSHDDTLQGRGAAPAPTKCPQPEPVTPGITKGMVRQRAYALYRDRLPQQPLTLADWVLAEKDLVQSLATESDVR